MQNDDYKYYKRELNKTNTTGEHPAKLRITDQTDQPSLIPMRHINLNAESAQALADWLWERFDAQGGPKAGY